MKSTENPTESGSDPSWRLLNETADTFLSARLDEIAILPQYLLSSVFSVFCGNLVVLPSDLVSNLKH